MLYWLRFCREFTVTCRISPWKVQAEDFVKKFQELNGHHISSISRYSVMSIVHFLLPQLSLHASS